MTREREKRREADQKKRKEFVTRIERSKFLNRTCLRATTTAGVYSIL